MDTRAPALCCHRKRATTCQADVLQGQSREAHRTRSTEQFGGAVREILHAVVFKTRRAARVLLCGSVHTTPMYFRTYEKCTNLDWTDWPDMRRTPCATKQIKNKKQSQLCCRTGLLHNWGVGLHSLGTHAGDAATSQAALEQAAQRLADSAAFSRADPAPLNALGDVRMAQASGQV